MNYEEKYKQALSRAAFYNGELPTENQRKMLVDIFPELAESDDERIRTKLIGFVENWEKGYNPDSPFDDYAIYTSDRDELDRILAWLEKQGKKLDPNKVIEWLAANVCDSEYYVKWFKQDFAPKESVTTCHHTKGGVR